MSFQAIYEFVLHIDSFRNIDLFQQGLYYLRFYLTSEENNKIQYAQPYHFLEPPKKQSNLPKVRDNHQWAPPSILDELSSFQTKTFMIRFQEEEVNINEIIYFKIELPAYPNYQSTNFILYCELMCADIQKIGGPPSEDQDSLFKCVSIFRSKIYNAHNSLHQYIPIQFDHNHFCIINTTLHTMLQDFKFRLSQFQVNQLQNENYQSGKSKLVLLQPKSFPEFLNKATNKFNVKDTELFFDCYVTLLKDQCITLQELLNKCQNAKVLDIQIPKFAYQQYTEQQLVLTDTQYQLMKNQKLTDTINLASVKNQHLLGNLIEADFNQFASTLFQLNNELVNFIKNNSKEFTGMLMKDYNLTIKDKWGECYLREQVKCNDLSMQSKDAQKTHQSISNKLRSQAHNFQIMDIEDLDLFPKSQDIPILFEEIHTLISGIPLCQNKNGIHLIVLVHGFQGNSYDMRLVKNNLSMKYPDKHYLMSRSNEEQTDGDINDMGKNLAQEVKQYLNEWLSGSNIRISFIGHSLGGIIIRAALPYLSELQDKMYSFVSLSSPHLGYMYNSSKIVEAGLWVLKRMRKSLCLQQLSMSDADRIEDTFLFKLSKQVGINWFKNIMFVGSGQDHYVPFESARVQKCQEAQNDYEKGRKYTKMVDNILSSLRTNKIHRVDVNFVLQEKSIDNMIGRTAHIQFLENGSFLKTLVNCTHDIFD